ncbi:alpha/beta hydrolase [Desulfuromonas carbonis]|uniref:alpha/beta fold hydrolase n=1 Tax=Desulfuromonas sp. DDH964 TaxID=1823759 RepID=UPI00078C70CD|nr:alpha/beta hydrolase [Desulfuromonas sp. DDH964]AMV73726.1 alpha/beta fold family hydrolase [Desulfuromonas sp. DDH964]
MEMKIPTPDMFYSHDGIPLACDCGGEGGPLLLFVHGWTCRRSYWRPQLDHFSSRYAVAAPDLPGHGDSANGSRSRSRSRWSVESFGRDIAACVDALTAREVVLVGHSMGGAVALEAARQLGAKVVGVVLVDTFVIDYGGLSAETVQAIAAPFQEDFAAAMAGLVEQTATAATPAALKKQLIEEMSTADPAWALPAWEALLTWSPQAAFSELRMPIYAINGALIPASARERCAPFVTETLVPGAGHFLQMEDPAHFNKVLEEVLGQLS